MTHALNKAMDAIWDKMKQQDNIIITRINNDAEIIQTIGGDQMAVKAPARFFQEREKLINNGR